MTITKSGNGNAIAVTHTGTSNLFYIDNNSDAGNAAIYVENTGARGPVLLATSGQGANQGDPLIYGESTDGAFDQPILKLIQAGSVNAFEVTGNSTFSGGITAAYGQLTTASATTLGTGAIAQTSLDDGGHLKIRNSNTTDNNFQSLIFQDSGGFLNAAIVCKNVDHDSVGGGDLRFFTRLDGTGADTSNERMRIGNADKFNFNLNLVTMESKMQN